MNWRYRRGSTRFWNSNVEEYVEKVGHCSDAISTDTFQTVPVLPNRKLPALFHLGGRYPCFRSIVGAQQQSKRPRSIFGDSWKHVSGRCYSAGIIHCTLSQLESGHNY